MKYKDISLLTIPLQVKFRYRKGKKMRHLDFGICKILESPSINYSCLPKKDGYFRADQHCCVLIWAKGRIFKSALSNLK